MGEEQDRKTDTGVSAARAWGPPLAVALVIFGLSTIPGDNLPRHSNLLSTIAHVTEFGFLGYFLSRALELQSLATSRWATVAWTVLICTAYGLLDELRQFLVPHRVFDLLDVLADGVGALTGTAVYVLFSAMQKRRVP